MGQGIKVLGLPVEHPDGHSFAANVLADIVSRLENACHLLSHLGNPHHQHLLLRYCLDACRLVHFLRAVPTQPHTEKLHDASLAIRRVLEDMLGPGSFDDVAWAQATLPIRMGGLGIKDPIRVRVPARISGALQFLKRARTLGFPVDSVVPPADLRPTLHLAQGSLGTAFAPLAEWLRTAELPDLRAVEADHSSQRWWSEALYSADRRALATNSPLRDQCRLAMQGLSHTSAWMDWTPGPEHRVILRRHGVQSSPKVVVRATVDCRAHAVAPPSMGLETTS